MAEDCALYLITPPQIDDLDAFAAQFEKALDAGPVACVQLRLKGVDEAAIRKAAERLMPLCHARDIAFLINDRADLAKELGADGVHLGQNDGDVRSARQLLGDEASIGVTCHGSIQLAYDAGEGGADYVAFGAFFASGTKPEATPAPMEILTAWDESTELPCVAIGGITPENCRELADAGAHFIAVCGAVWGHPVSPADAVRAFQQALP